MTRSTLEGTAAAVLLSAPASGQGKSIVTAALARLHRNAGRRVRVFKYGPDYLDPMVLERASGAPVYQIHMWMTGEAECRWRLAEAAAEADVVFVEGSMGLHDGDPSTADLAARMGLPVLPVIDARGMAQTFGAVVHGLASWRTDLCMEWVIANRVGSSRHTDMLRDSLPAGIGLLGGVPRNAAMDIPDRHLGILQASEIHDLDARLDDAAGVLEGAGLGRLPEPVTLRAPAPAAVGRHLEGVRIAVARDAAFAFLYPANLDLLERMGADLTFFSPLRDEVPDPEAGAVWLPGGYPELHLDTLAGLKRVPGALRAHHAAGRPVLAECGGLMYCMDAIRDQEGRSAPGLGLLPGEAVMTGSLQGLGLQRLPLDTVFPALSGQELRGHTFHHSNLETDRRPDARTVRLQTGSEAEPVYREGALTGSYFHAYFPSAPTLAARLFRGSD